MIKIKISLEALWKIAVLLLLAAIAFYSYRVHTDLAGSYYTPPVVGCGGFYGAATTTTASPMMCVRPMQSSVK